MRILHRVDNYAPLFIQKSANSNSVNLEYTQSTDSRFSENKIKKSGELLELGHNSFPVIDSASNRQLLNLVNLRQIAFYIFLATSIFGIFAGYTAQLPEGFQAEIASTYHHLDSADNAEFSVWFAGVLKGLLPKISERIVDSMFHYSHYSLLLLLVIFSGFLVSKWFSGKIHSTARLAWEKRIASTPKNKKMTNLE